MPAGPGAFRAASPVRARERALYLEAVVQREFLAAVQRYCIGSSTAWYWLFYCDTPTALVAKEKCGPYEVRAFVWKLATRARDAQNVASAIRQRFRGLCFLLDTRTEDR
jgi:hypothetical protein